MQRNGIELNTEHKRALQTKGRIFHTYPDKHRQVGCVRSRVNVQEEAVLVSQGRVEPIDLRQAITSRLRTQRGLVDGRDKTSIASWWLRGLPSQAAYWRGGITNAGLSSVTLNPDSKLWEPGRGVYLFHTSSPYVSSW